MAKEEKKPVVGAKQPVYKFPVNEARGEARLMIDDVELVLAATMHGLAAVSSRLQCKSLDDLFKRLAGVEPGAMLAGVEILTTKGDVAKALDKLRMKHASACADTFNVILAHHFDGDEGNAEAVDEAA